jgi:hypothetical protein
VRVDTGVEDGDAITPFYDPMIAKLIATPPTREQPSPTWPRPARGRGLAGEDQRRLPGPLPGDAGLHRGAVDTGLIARELEALTARAEPSPEALRTAGWAFREAVERAADGHAPGRTCGLPPERPPSRPRRLFLGDQAVEVRCRWSRRASSTVGDDEVVVFEAARRSSSATIPPVADGGGAPATGHPRAHARQGHAALGQAGDTVTKGQPLLTLEAMKMEHALHGALRRDRSMRSRPNWAPRSAGDSGRLTAKRDARPPWQTGALGQPDLHRAFLSGCSRRRAATPHCAPGSWTPAPPTASCISRSGRPDLCAGQRRPQRPRAPGGVRPRRARRQPRRLPANWPLAERARPSSSTTSWTAASRTAPTTRQLDRRALRLGGRRLFARALDLRHVHLVGHSWGFHRRRWNMRPRDGPPGCSSLTLGSPLISTKSWTKAPPRTSPG